MTNLTGNVAIVTGGGGSIGRATVQRLREAGADVVAVDLSLEAMQPLLVDELPGQVELAQGNVLDEGLPAAVVAGAIERFGKVDLLVNNAGMGSELKPLWEIDLATFKRDLDINLTSQFSFIHAVVPHMIAGGYGRIVNVASQAGMEGHALSGGYGAAKGGVIALTKILGKELADKGVIVNAIAPALINSGMLNQPWFTEEMKQSLLGRIPMGRLGEPSEVAEMIAYLCSPAVTFTTGSIFDLSGGRASY
jgi:NAD(P)-dependent dehydrogenase (short-subunit alcohol dehydrogenase family)